MKICGYRVNHYRNVVSAVLGLTLVDTDLEILYFCYGFQTTPGFRLITEPKGMFGKNLPNLELKNFPHILLICLITVGLVSDLPSTASGPAEFILGWDANSEADLDGYEIYVRKGTTGATYTFLAEVYLDELEEPDNPKVTISELYNGLLTDLSTPVVRMAELTNNSTYHFALTAFDTQGRTSDFSEELCVKVIGTSVVECGSANDSSDDDSVVSADNISNGGGGGGGGCFIAASSFEFRETDVLWNLFHHGSKPLRCINNMAKIR
jgi:hypothetical protein